MKTFTTYAEKKAKQFFNLLQGYTKGIRITAILILLLMGVSNAWAGDPSISGFGLQFQDDGGHWFKTGTKEGDGIMDIDLGSKTNLKIVYIYANGNKNGGNICDNSYFKYEIYGETGTQNWGGIRHSSVDWGTPTFKWGSNNSSTAQIDLVKNRKPGDYRMEFLISFEGNSNSNSCGNWYDCKYSGGNWKFSWSIPDPTITITGANALVVGTSTNIKASMSNYPIGATISKIQVSGNTTSKSATGTTDNLTVSSVTPNASGKNGITVTVTVKFGTGGTKDYTYTYDVTPPSVKNFTVTSSGNVISGSGTQNDPYIIKYNSSFTLTLSGSQNHTDANSTIQYNTSGTWNTTQSKTISNINSTDIKNVTVKARYKNNSDANLCGAESSKTIYYRSEQVYTVTFNANGHGTAPAAQTVSQGSKATQPTAPTATGYTFGGWYKEAGCTNAFDFNTAINANITLYAKWIPYGDCVFFKNNLNWDEVYVYFYSSDKYWTDDKGTGANMDSEFPMSSSHRPHYRKFRGKMTRIGLTDIWYFDYISAAKQIDPTYWAEIKESKDIAFTAHEQYDHSFFDNTKVIRRGDFKPDMQLFIPQTDQTPTYLNKHDGVSTRYYNKGLWMIYNSTESGYNWSSNVGNWDNNKNYFTSEIAGGYSFTAEVELNAGSTYEFKIHNQNGTWFGKNGTMTQDNCTNWWFKEEVNDNAKIKPTVTGTYIFTAYLGDGKVMISLDYPLSTGDYRLAYLDNTANSFHPGHYLKKRNENKLDTVSFFIHHDKQPQVIAQRCKDIDAQGNATWETITSIKFNPAAPITESGVYNFTLEQLAGQTDPRLLSQAPPYTGDYYIRTDAAPGGWKSFRQIGNMMTYNSYADEHEDFDHYFCEWVSQEKGLKNVKYTVANDYSYCISDTLKQDVDPAHPIIVENEDGDLPIKNGSLVNANVRWGWDSKNNKIRRAYMAAQVTRKTASSSSKEMSHSLMSTAIDSQEIQPKDKTATISQMMKWYLTIWVTGFIRWMSKQTKIPK